MKIYGVYKPGPNQPVTHLVKGHGADYPYHSISGKVTALTLAVMHQEQSLQNKKKTKQNKRWFKVRRKRLDLLKQELRRAKAEALLHGPSA